MVVDDRPVHQPDNPVGVPGDIPVVGDDDEGLVVAPGHPDDHLHHLGGGVAVEVSGRFVGEDDRGLTDKGPGNADPLLLAAGHLGGPVLHPALEPDPDEHLFRRFLPLLFGDPLKGEGHRDVFQRRVLGHQVVGLEDKADVLPPEDRQLLFAHAGDLFPGDPDLAFGRLFQPRHDV